MKLYFVFSIFIFFFISAIAGQTIPDELSPECKGIREKLEKNMAIIENTANTAEMIQQRDCNFAKNSVKLTKKYNKCLPRNGQQGMDNVLKNMRFISKMICENINKRILGCFSPDNLRQFNKCTNKTIQYMDFIAKQEKKRTETTNLSKPQIRKKRFLFQDFLSGISDGIQGTIQSGIQTGSGFLGGGLLKRNMKADKFGSTSFEYRCCQLIKEKRTLLFRFRRKNYVLFSYYVCQLHLKSDCFVNKVLHTCADKSELRLAKAFQTVFSLAVKDVVEIACGKIQTLDQCEKFSNDWDVEEDLGF